MSVVVERGLARCPRCVAIADYTFVESGLNSVRYEVRCRRCGEAYREVHTPVTPDFSTAVATLPPPCLEPRPGGRRTSLVVRQLASRITQRCKALRPRR